jgi:hypothetical protein
MSNEKILKIGKGEDLESAIRGFTGIVEFLSGDKWWLINGLHHREDGPAVIPKNGIKLWWLNGKPIATDFLFKVLQGNFIVLERGIPTDDMFGKLKLTQAKLLTANGTVFVHDNLPGGDTISD